MPQMNIGDRFRVTETINMTDEIGNVITRFLTDFGYTVTPRNHSLIQAAADEGKVEKIIGSAEGAGLVIS